MPSIRRLATQLSVSVNTVKEAYELLEVRGVIEARPQSGYYVSARLPESPADTVRSALLLRSAVPEVEARAKSLRHDLDPLLNEVDSIDRLMALLFELNYNAAICWRHRRYADFLARVYRFQEAVLRYLVEKVFGLSTDLGPTKAQITQLRWEEGIRARAELLEYLEGSRMRQKNLDWRAIGRPVYKILLSFAVKEKRTDESIFLLEQDRPRYAALLERVNALDRLVELRHRTIVGHDFQGVSEQAILDVSPKQGSRASLPPEALDEIVRMLVVDFPGAFRSSLNPYEQLASFIIQKLKEEH